MQSTQATAATDPSSAHPSVRPSYLDDLIAPRADAYKADRRVRQVLETVEIGARGRREIGEAADAADGFLPPGQLFVDRLDAIHALEVRGHAVEQFAVELVSHRHRDLGEAVEHIELGHREPGEAVDAHCVAHDDA